MSDTVVIYHGGGCRDGFCAAWCMWRAYPDAEFHPVNYGEPLPDVARRRVFVVDFCPEADPLRRLVAFNKQVAVLDHHRTAEEVLYEVHRKVNDLDKFWFKFSPSKSGARLAWEHAYAVKWYDAGQVPWVVQYVEDRDLWRWQLPHSREINAALRLVPLDFDAWCELAATDPESLIDRGRAILERDAEIVASHVRHAVPTAVGGHTVPAVNATVLISEIGHELSKGQPFSATYFDDLKAGVRRWSLRSQPDGLDVSEVARRLGGGGHRNAAGFEQRVGTMEVSG
jgi:hypothetical protein